MTGTAIKFSACNALLVLAAGIFPAVTQAQQVFRIVGPDGKVTFSDQQPPPSTKATVTSATSETGKAAVTAALPFELRRVVGQYPVTLYSGDNCGPCISAHAMLTARGIPFAEKTVTTFEDTQALQRLSGDSSLPFLTIGSQQLKGFSDAEWTQFLDAAGYPKSSVLPASYRQAPAAPLVATAPAAAAVVHSGGAQPATPPATPVTPSPAANNPAGIRF